MTSYSTDAKAIRKFGWIAFIFFGTLCALAFWRQKTIIFYFFGFLSFLGLGVQAPMPSLGALISDGAQHMAVFWWELVFPGATMALLLLSLNFLGDGIRDALDPQLRGEQK